MCLVLILLSIQGFAQKGDCFIEIVSKAGVKVYLDGEFKGITSNENNGLFIQGVSPGKHDIMLVKANFKPQRERIHLKKRQVLSYRVKPFITKIKPKKPDSFRSLQIKKKKGDILIQSLPTSIRVIIKSLNVDDRKIEDKLLLEDVPIGNYSALFIWKFKRLNYIIKVEHNMTTHIMVNMIKKDVKNLYETDVMKIRKLERERARYDSIAAENLKMMEREKEAFIQSQERERESLRIAHEKEVELFKLFREEQFEMLDKSMVFVRGGDFTMGGAFTNSKPKRELMVRSFEISKYEVTRDLWFAVMGCDKIDYKNNQTPISNVRWMDVQVFLQKLYRLTGLRYRLPSEVEWEYAASGGRLSKGYKFAGSNNLRQLRGKGNIYHHETVGMRIPNELGLYNMTGNVWEICEDKWHDNYQGAPNNGRAWVDNINIGHVIRGGGHNGKRAYYDVRFRAHEYSPFAMDDEIGFRLVRSK